MTFEVGKTYRSVKPDNGEWRAIYAEGDTLWCAGVLKSGLGVAYRFSRLTGNHIDLNSNYDLIPLRQPVVVSDAIAEAYVNGGDGCRSFSRLGIAAAIEQWRDEQEAAS